MMVMRGGEGLCGKGTGRLPREASGRGCQDRDTLSGRSRLARQYKGIGDNTRKEPKHGKPRARPEAAAKAHAHPRKDYFHTKGKPL